MKCLALILCTAFAAARPAQAQPKDGRRDVTVGKALLASAVGSLALGVVLQQLDRQAAKRCGGCDGGTAIIWLPLLIYGAVGTVAGLRYLKVGYAAQRETPAQRPREAAIQLGLGFPFGTPG